jgi:hypothetical protein
MAEYRTLKMSFWSDPYIEELPPMTKLTYLYLVTSPHTNNLGVLGVSRRKMAYETGLTEQQIDEQIKRLKADGKVMEDGNSVLVLNFIKNQTTISKFIMRNLKALLKEVESPLLRKALTCKYPFLRRSEEELQDTRDLEGVSEVPETEETVSIPLDIPSIPLQGVSIPPEEYEVEVEVEVEVEPEVEVETKEKQIIRRPPKSADPPDVLGLKPEEPPRKQVPVQYEKIVELWNNIIGPRGRPLVKECTDQRKPKLRRLWKDRPMADFREIKTWDAFFQFCTQSDFLMGSNFFTFDWVLNQTNFQKILEGNYHQKAGGVNRPWSNRSG